MDTTQEHEFASNVDLDSDFSNWISDDSKELDSEFDHAKGLEYIYRVSLMILTTMSTKVPIQQKTQSTIQGWSSKTTRPKLETRL